MRAKSLQLGPTLYDPVDCSLPGSSVHGDSPDKNTGVDLPFPPFLTQGLNLESLPSPALAGGFFTASTAWEAPPVVASGGCPLEHGLQALSCFSAWAQ